MGRYANIRVRFVCRIGGAHYALCDIEYIGKEHMANQNSKHCDFTFALHDESQAFRIIEELPDFDTWAYIRHFPDDDNGSIHYHFYIHIKQPISLKAIANKLDLPIHMIEWVRNKTKLIQYLKHDNHPDKIQYDDDEIKTNNREYINNFLYPETNYVNVWDEVKLLDDLNSSQTLT